jgi:hypothetical protein
LLITTRRMARWFMLTCSSSNSMSTACQAGPYTVRRHLSQSLKASVSLVPNLFTRQHTEPEAATKALETLGVIHLPFFLT